MDSLSDVSFEPRRKMDSLTKGTAFKKHAYSKEGRYDPHEVVLKLVLDESGNPDRIVWGEKHHRVKWSAVKYVVWGHYSPAFANINKNMQLEELTCFSIFCERTILDFQHDEIGKVEIWVNALRELLGQTRDDVNKFIARLKKTTPTILPKRIPKQVHYQKKEVITTPQAHSKEDEVITRPRANTSVDLAGEYVQTRPRTPHMLIPGKVEPGLVLDDKSEKRETGIDIENDEGGDDGIAGMFFCCTDYIAFFIAYLIHSISVAVLFIATFPWASLLLCSNIDRSSCRFGKTIIGSSFLLNICLLFGPFHYWKSTHSLDHHMITELSISMTAFVWFVCHTCCCSMPQTWLLELCCITPPTSTLSADEKDGEYNGKIYFLQLASTLAFLMSITAGLGFALCLELWRISDRHPLSQLILYGASAVLSWLVLVRVFCQSLVSTFGNSLNAADAEQPLLSDGSNFSGASTVMRHTESEPP